MVTAVEIIQVFNPPLIEAYYQLRFEVLRKPWHQTFDSTMDSTESISHHFIGLLNNQVVATGRLEPIKEKVFQVRSMAVHPQYQRQGIGEQMLEYLEKFSLAKGMLKIELDARENALNFYKKCGYATTEKSYLLFNEIQHFKMEKWL